MIWLDLKEAGEFGFQQAVKQVRPRAGPVGREGSRGEPGRAQPGRDWGAWRLGAAARAKRSRQGRRRGRQVEGDPPRHFASLEGPTGLAP